MGFIGFVGFFVCYLVFGVCSEILVFEFFFLGYSCSFVDFIVVNLEGVVIFEVFDFFEEIFME